MNPCSTCGKENAIVNQCRCDPNNLPTRTTPPRGFYRYGSRPQSECGAMVLTEFDQKLYDLRLQEWEHTPGPRVGDFLKLWTKPTPCPAWHHEFTRFTHDWGDHIQTGGNGEGFGGSYYWGGNYCSYSGGLDSGCAKSDLIYTGEIRQGGVWFFSDNHARAHNGVDVTIPCRVFTLRPGADTHGIEFENERFYLYMRTPKQMEEDPRAYLYTIERNSYSHIAFHKERDLIIWLDSMGFTLRKPLAPGWEGKQRLAHKEAA
jgi:hypothetical protein